MSYEGPLKPFEILNPWKFEDLIDSLFSVWILTYSKTSMENFENPLLIRTIISFVIL